MFYAKFIVANFGVMFLYIEDLLDECFRWMFYTFKWIIAKFKMMFLYIVLLDLLDFFITKYVLFLIHF